LSQAPLHDDLVVMAKQFAAHGAWRHAVLECTLALEVFVDRLLRTELVERQGMPESDFEALLDREGRSLSDRMNKPMRRAINWSPITADPQLWERWLEMDEVRRLIAYQASSATAEQAVEAVAVTDELMGLMERGRSLGLVEAGPIR
jgi:hypothetical protein